jgi:hypothetical protein
LGVLARSKRGWSGSISDCSSTNVASLESSTCNSSACAPPPCQHLSVRKPFLLNHPQCLLERDKYFEYHLSRRAGFLQPRRLSPANKIQLRRKRETQGGRTLFHLDGLLSVQVLRFNVKQGGWARATELQSDHTTKIIRRFCVC